jgi:serine/threonine protein kinase
MTGDVTRDGRSGGTAPYRQTEQDGPLDTIGPYRRITRLGEGGMGVVYRGADPAGRDVAIKVLKPEIAEDSTALRRLAREVDTMRRVRSPHVADVLDGDVTADHPYIVTRFVPGRPLDEVVAHDGPLRASALRVFALGLAKALVAIHEAGVVHRDLKPSNVMLVDGEPVVIDFGIAQAADSTRLTQTGMMTGTPGYMAPEIFDEERASPASDVHAWAATVAFAATGRPPFGQGSLEVVFFNIINGRAQLTGVPEPLLALLRSALARDPAQRPTAVALVEAVTALDVPPDDVTQPDRPPAPQQGQPARDVTQMPTRLAAGPPGGPMPAPATSWVPPPGPHQPPYHQPPHPAAQHVAGPGTAMRGVPAAGLAVAPAWSRLFAYLVVATVVSIAIMMPIVGIVLAVAAVFVLHAGDAAAERPGASTGALGLLTAPLAAPAALLRGAMVTALTIPYAAVFAVAITLMLVSLVTVGLQPNVLGACAWGVGASVYVLWAGPGVHAPRRQLMRVFGAVAPEPRRIALVGVVLGTVAFVAVVGAVSLTPSFAPMYGLQNMLSSSLERLQTAIS